MLADTQDGYPKMSSRTVARYRSRLPGGGARRAEPSEGASKCGKSFDGIKSTKDVEESPKAPRARRTRT